MIEMFFHPCQLYLIVASIVMQPLTQTEDCPPGLPTWFACFWTP